MLYTINVMTSAPVDQVTISNHELSVGGQGIAMDDAPVGTAWVTAIMADLLRSRYITARDKVIFHKNMKEWFPLCMATVLGIRTWFQFSSSACLSVFSEDKLKWGRSVVQLPFRHSEKLLKVGKYA